MSKIGIALSAVVLIGGVAAVALQDAQNKRLESEIAALREDVRQAGAAVAQRERSAGMRANPTPAVSTPDATAADHAEVARLRDEVAAMRKNAQELARAMQSAQAPVDKNATIPTNLKPASAWTNAGKATPATAIETVLWAAAGGDVEAVADTIALSPTARQKADALWAQLSDETRAKYGTPEKLM